MREGGGGEERIKVERWPWMEGENAKRERVGGKD